MGSYDVICIGDAKLDSFLKIIDTNGKIRFDDSTNELCFKHGEKISVDRTFFSVGGNAANVVIGLTRLGIKSTIAAEIGSDEFSLKIINTFANEHIDRGFIKHADGESSFSFAITYNNDRILFSEHRERKHDFSYENAHTKWIYLTSLGLEWNGAYQKAIEYASTHQAKIAFNPGTLQLSEKSSVIQNVLRFTDILLVNKEEAKQLIYDYVNEYNSDEIQQVISKVKELGPKTIVITDGNNGSYVLNNENNYFHQEPFPCDLVELTGAGDAFSSGFLAATIHGLDTQEAMIWGSYNSASVIAQIGAEAGLMNKYEMEEKINESR